MPISPYPLYLERDSEDHALGQSVIINWFLAPKHELPQGAALRGAHLYARTALYGLEQFQLAIKVPVPHLLGRVNEMAEQPASCPVCKNILLERG